jgi:hypothetical protein
MIAVEKSTLKLARYRDSYAAEHEHVSPTGAMATASGATRSVQGTLASADFSCTDRQPAATVEPPKTYFWCGFQFLGGVNNS